jgi:hypothetical protein
VAETASGEEGLEVGGKRQVSVSHHSPGLLVFTTKIGEQTSDDGLRRVEDGMQPAGRSSYKLEA